MSWFVCVYAGGARYSMCVHGSAGSSEVGSTAPVSPKMSFGPWPMKCCAIGAPANATRTRRMMKIPLAIATLSRLKRIQTSSQ